MAKVVRNVKDFNPFVRLKFLRGGRPDPSFSDRNPDGSYRYRPKQFVAGQWFREHLKKDGAAVVWGKLNCDGNGKRRLEALGDFVPPDEAPGVTPDELYERYSQSVSRQLAA